MGNLRSYTEEEKLKIYANGGDLTYDETGIFKYLPLDVNFNPQSLANVLSLKHVNYMPGYHLEMNTKTEPGTFPIKTERNYVFI